MSTSKSSSARPCMIANTSPLSQKNLPCIFRIERHQKVLTLNIIVFKISEMFICQQLSINPVINNQQPVWPQYCRLVSGAVSEWVSSDSNYPVNPPPGQVVTLPSGTRSFWEQLYSHKMVDLSVMVFGYEIHHNI